MTPSGGNIVVFSGWCGWIGLPQVNANTPWVRAENAEIEVVE